MHHANQLLKQIYKVGLIIFNNTCNITIQPGYVCLLIVLNGAVIQCLLIMSNDLVIN